MLGGRNHCRLWKGVGTYIALSWLGGTGEEWSILFCEEIFCLWKEKLVAH